MPESTPKTPSKYQRLLTNTAVFTVGKLLSKLLMFFMIGLYTACMTEAEFGTAELITNMANLLIPLACVGISEGIFRSAAAKDGDKEAFFTNGLLVYGVGSVVFLCLSPLLGFIPRFEGSVWLIAAYVVVANLHTVVSQYLCAIGRTKLFAGQGILNTALVIGFNILFLPVLDFGVTGYVAAVILADLVTTVFLILFTRLWRAVKPRSISKQTIVTMLKFCLPLVPTTIFWWITGVSDRYMVDVMCSPEMNGLYTAAYKIPNLLIYAIAIFDSAWKLSVSAEEDPEACAAFYSKVWRVYTTLAFLGGGCLILGSRVLAGLLFAGDFVEAWVYIPTLTFATVFTALCTFLGSVYFASKRTVGSMLTALAGAVLNVVLNLLLIPPFGAMGASVATFASYFAVCILRLVTGRRLIPFKGEWGRLIVNTALMGALTVIVTFSERNVQYMLLMYGAAAGVFVLMLAFNARAILELLRNAKGLLRGR
ncbi:MAG: polysaccharide biosynthesis C-terminal domain-containing protein [Clostridia bacterium]|nr:polysaccharide biosynthesis C-terminal domain-containing protein [Clostridia bacterium]